MSPAASQPTGSKDQVARLLTLVPLLHVHGEMRLGDAAVTLGVTPQQLLKDLKVLFLCGLPGGYPDDLIDVELDALETEEGEARTDGVIRISNADYLARPLRLTATEASAIIVALRAMRRGTGDDTREIVDRVLVKLEAAAAQGPAASRIDPGEDDIDPEMLALSARLQGAADHRMQVRLTYYVPARDEESERVVDPRGVVTSGGLTYLDAWCHSAEAPRLFRLDRIATAQVLDTPIETPAEAPRDLGDGIFTRSGDTEPVTVRLAPAARWVVEYYPVEEVRPQPDGSVEVDLLVADQRWLTKLMMRLAPNAWIVTPAAYAQAYRANAQATLDLYS
ncbi:MAG: WYL domain-containing protein [Nocardioides sp.]